MIAIRKIGTPAVEPLIAALKGEDYHVRKEAAGALKEKILSEQEVIL